MTSLETIARILRADKNYLAEVDHRLVQATGAKEVFDKIIKENEEKMHQAMTTLGVAPTANAHQIYEALIGKVGADDKRIFEVLGKPDSRSTAECQRIATLAKNAVNPPKGLFLKLDKAKEFLIKEPPREVMRFLGYGNVAEMIEKEDLFEVYSSLRFIEGNEWLNNTFFKQYEHLTPTDFEEREVVVRALGEKWGEEASKFVAKKHHNISHLKELGVVFIIPTTLGIPGEILRMITLIGHYLYEVPFYADMFRLIAKEPGTFAPNLISLLRGDVPTARHLSEDPATWLVIQRYLAKDDENDWRLSAAHINPEALHWAKAIATLPKIAEAMGESPDALSFWSNLGWIGDYFKDESGVDVLVSFDLVDTVMSLVQQKEMIKYLYHHEETLWNKIFTAYLGDEEIEKRAREHLLTGFFKI
ncbi:MAG: hypothetical protein AAB691_00905 [Patescibacteria group bacterium]